MSTHTIQVEIEIERDEDCVYPMIELTFDYERGYTPGIPRGEYAPIDPPVTAGVEFRGAKLVKADGLPPDPQELQDLAELWLIGPGYLYACDCAETDLRAMRHAQ